jgi:glycosyltransferase involved in cell wall biosynthesis
VSIKVVHLITSLDRGGAQTMLTRLVLGMDRARFEPLVVSLLDGGAQGSEIEAGGIRVLGLGMRRGVPSLAAVLRLRKIIRDERPAVLQSWLYHADLLGLCAAGRVPLAWNIRLSAIAGERKAAQLGLLRRVLAAASRRPAVVIANSEAGRRAHAALGYRPRRWEIVPNGFDTDRFRPDAERRRGGRERLGFADAHRVIGMVARVDGMKDHATFLEAAARIAARQPAARFVLVGAGTDALALPGGLAGVTRTLGERGDVETLLPALDLHVLASKGEGFPNALGEAMACAVPCVASDVGDAALLIGDTGAVVPPRDATALSEAILALLGRGPDGLRQLGAAARERVVARYSLAAMVRRYEAIYAGLAGRR